jgi:hypothetical protein
MAKAANSFRFTKMIFSILFVCFFRDQDTDLQGCELEFHDHYSTPFFFFFIIKKGKLSKESNLSNFPILIVSFNHNKKENCKKQVFIIYEF